MTDCIFCKIIKGELPCSKIYEDDKIFSFLDIGPVNKGHTLVIPKEHHEVLMDVPDDLLKELALAVKKISKAVMKGTGCDGLTVGISNYKAGGQVVPHAHFHIMPRLEDDGLKMWPQGKYDDGEMDNYKDKIINALK
ncbi:MAG: HIT family protein [Candidatus Woesearchaeota archaeon]|jgi:histidine triad (HIT) family protein|nr:HIT family protein [Candidatus Woesearchaeota archaeon]MDP7457334.1 HIT family protein [Candidatus Woesearchaeota archaeon]|tara:strand:- start:165 stop:575 length:411 start_codon:yes stop_codon:yes gene_type:complete